jgi:hypothetical protein
MDNNVDRLDIVQGRSPDILKRNLKAISVPFEIMAGSWFCNGAMHGVWIMYGMPARMVKKKTAKKSKQIETAATSTETVRETDASEASQTNETNEVNNGT